LPKAEHNAAEWQVAMQALMLVAETTAAGTLAVSQQKVCSEADHHPPSCCRQYWGSQVAYTSQFGTAIVRAHLGRAKLKEKLCSPNLDDWGIPAKPPNMRWATYHHLIKQYRKYEAVLFGAYSTDFE
jgi:hypothetical protein